MTGSWWWDLLLSIAGALLLAWVALIVVLAIVRPRKGLLREAVRLLPDVLRLIRRPAQMRTSAESWPPMAAPSLPTPSRLA